MSYIDNQDLRKWVKENLRKAIFQKAHALAIQTGCEILVKLEDHNDDAGNLYYATHSLLSSFKDRGVREKPGDLCVSGETGLPVVEFAVQSSLEHKPTHPLVIGNRDSFGFVPTVDSLSRHGSKHKSPGHNKRNGPHVTDISPPSTSNSEGTITPTKRVKTHHNDKHTPSHGSDALNSSASKDANKEKVSPPSSHLTLSPVPVKQFQCTLCGKRYKSAKTLQKHTKTLHSQSEQETGASKERREPSHSTTQQSPALTPISPERYPCQKCEQTFDCPDDLEAHVKEFHKKLAKHHKSESLMSQNAASPSSKKHTPKRDNHTPRRDDSRSWGDEGGGGGKASKREGSTPKHGHRTPKQDHGHHGSKQEHGNHSSNYEHGHHSSKHEHHKTPKQEHSHHTPKHEHGHHHTPKQEHTPRRENHTPKHELTPKHDVTPKRDLTPKSDVTPSRHNLADHNSPLLPLLGVSPQQPFGISPPALSSASSSPLSAPKTPGETIETQFSFEHDTHTSLVDLPASPAASHSSGSEPSRPNTPGDTPSLTYEFSDEIQQSIMNKPSISSASELIQESPASPIEQHYTPPRSAKTYRMSPPDSMPHKKQTSPRKSVARGSEIKSAILSTPGPIVTTLSLQNNGPQSLRHVTRIQFESAIQGLQIADFGYVVPLTVDNAVLVFVKKSPAEIQDVWNEKAAELGLCSLDRYHELYNMPAPRDISEHVKSQLIEQGHVTEEQMNGMNESYHYTMSMEY